LENHHDPEHPATHHASARDSSARATRARVGDTLRGSTCATRSAKPPPRVALRERAAKRGILNQGVDSAPPRTGSRSAVSVCIDFTGRPGGRRTRQPTAVARHPRAFDTTGSRRRESRRQPTSADPPRQRTGAIPSRAATSLRLPEARIATRRSVAFSISARDGAACSRTHALSACVKASRGPRAQRSRPRIADTWDVTRGPKKRDVRTTVRLPEDLATQVQEAADADRRSNPTARVSARGGVRQACPSQVRQVRPRAASARFSADASTEEPGQRDHRYQRDFRCHQAGDGTRRP